MATSSRNIVSTQPGSRMIDQQKSSYFKDFYPHRCLWCFLDVFRLGPVLNYGFHFSEKNVQSRTWNNPEKYLENRNSDSKLGTIKKRVRVSTWKRRRTGYSSNLFYLLGTQGSEIFLGLFHSTVLYIFSRKNVNPIYYPQIQNVEKL